MSDQMAEYIVFSDPDRLRGETADHVFMVDVNSPDQGATARCAVGLCTAGPAAHPKKPSRHV